MHHYYKYAKKKLKRLNHIFYTVSLFNHVENETEDPKNSQRIPLQDQKPNHDDILRLQTTAQSSKVVLRRQSEPKPNQKRHGDTWRPHRRRRRRGSRYLRKAIGYRPIPGRELQVSLRGGRRSRIGGGRGSEPTLGLGGGAGAVRGGADVFAGSGGGAAAIDEGDVGI